MADPTLKLSPMKTYVIVYLLILLLAAVQVVLAYFGNPLHLLFRMLLVAVFQAALAVVFFMHMRSERQALVIALIPTTVFVLLMMNMIWTDSFRLMHMRPFPK